MNEGAISSLSWPVPLRSLPLHTPRQNYARGGIDKVNRFTSLNNRELDCLHREKYVDRGAACAIRIYGVRPRIRCIANLASDAESKEPVHGAVREKIVGTCDGRGRRRTNIFPSLCAKPIHGKAVS